jgi:uncharacterized membrane-anchored protein YitT (DUF2179 family)
MYMPFLINEARLLQSYEGWVTNSFKNLPFGFFPVARVGYEKFLTKIAGLQISNPLPPNMPFWLFLWFASFLKKEPPSMQARQLSRARAGRFHSCPTWHLPEHPMHTVQPL